MSNSKDKRQSHGNAFAEHSLKNKLKYSTGSWMNPIEVHERWHFRRAIGIIEKVQPGTFLDIGCSNSALGRYLHKKGWEAHGIEISDAGKIAAEGGVIIHPIDVGQDWDLSENTFDVIFAGEIIEHVLDTGRFARNMYRLAKPGGVIIATTPNITSLENRLRSIIGVHPRFMDFGFAEVQVGHCRYFTRKKMRELLLQVGFCDIHVGTGNACLSLKIRGKDLQLPGILNLLKLGSNLFAVARKPIR